MLLLCLLPLLAACPDSNQVYEPIPGTDDCFHTIYREGERVAEVNISPVAFRDSTKFAQPVQEQLALLWRQRLEQLAAKAERVVADKEFNNNLPPWQVCYTVEEFPTDLYADNRLISITLEGSEYTLGEAHTFNYRYTCNLDAVTGQQLTLEDFWGADAREKAAAQIYAQIESEGRLDDFYPGLEENLLLNISADSWYMSVKSIHIIYNPYSIGPYALGIVEFALPKQGSAQL